MVSGTSGTGPPAFVANSVSRPKFDRWEGFAFTAAWVAAASSRGVWSQNRDGSELATFTFGGTLGGKGRRWEGDFNRATS